MIAHPTPSGKTKAPMQRILLISTDIVGAAMAGPGMRALALAQVLGARHAVTLAVPQGSAPPPGPFTVAIYQPGAAGAFAPLLAQSNLVIGQGFAFAFHPELLHHDLPLAIDLYDPLILESLDLLRHADATTAQAHAAKYVQLTQAQLQRGDFFFCATEPQRDYWLGALSVLGRLSPALFASADRDLRSLIDLVPSGIEPLPPTRGAPVLRGVHPAIGADDLVLVWAGGLWDWFDPLTIVRAVAELRAACPQVRLVFFAGARPNPHGPPIVPQGIAEVRALAAELGVLDTTVILLDQWVPFATRGHYLAEADLGVSAHQAGVETRFAFRTRLLDYLWARLPVLTTTGDSLGATLETAGAALSLPPGDVMAWRQAIAQLAADAERVQAMRRAADLLAAQFTWTQVAQPLLAFCDQPRRTSGALPADPAARIAQLEAALDERERYVRHVEAVYHTLAQRPPSMLQRLRTAWKRGTQ
jgi:glycosyltransferase involved in cell wall biosynthesis